MYEPVINNKVQWLSDLVSTAGLDPAPVVAPIPDALLRWLVDLRLLRHVPLHYLVPDPRLLPPESIRFFHVDPTWTDRLIDGALAAGNVGTMDQGFTAHVMRGVRAQVDEALAAEAELEEGSWGEVTVTGLLMRSAAVRRWPGMEVRAYADESGDARVPNLRVERVAPGILIALFAGVPGRVELQEPNEGTQFGFEPGDIGGLSLQPRQDSGELLEDGVQVPLRAGTPCRAIHFRGLRSNIAKELELSTGEITPWRLAYSMQQAPYVQVFRGADDKDDGHIGGLTAWLQNRGLTLGIMGGG